MNVICISGKAQHGKDTTAGYLKEFLEERGKKVLICHYGDLVKYVCKTFFDWDGVKDEAGRTILQQIGTNLIRTQSPDYWVAFINDILYLCGKHAGWDYVLIPDCRFPNEIEYLMYEPDEMWEVVHIRVVRDDPYWTSPLTEEQQNHPSETALDRYPSDYVVHNDSDLEHLRSMAKVMVGYWEDA